MIFYLQGVLFGVVPVFFVGPVLFTLLRASLRGGFWAGAKVAAGIAVSDVVAIALCALGVGQLFTQSWGRSALELGGGLILAGFGMAMILSQRRAPALEGAPPPSWGLFASGFLVNFVNPFVFAFWIGALGSASARYRFDASALVPFFAGVVTTIFVTDVLKARLAEALGARLSHGSGLLAQRLSGVALWLFGAYFAFTALATLLGRIVDFD